jgi:hypothetical protein
MHSRRFIPMVDELSRRIAPSGGATSDVMSPATSDVSGVQVNPMVMIPNTHPYTCAIPVDWSEGVD